MPGLSPSPSQSKPNNWRGEIRVNIARACCRITKMETKLTAYSYQRLENVWRRSVMLNVTVQRLSDQLSVILRNNFLHPAILERVRYGAGNSLNMDNVTSPNIM